MGMIRKIQSKKVIALWMMVVCAMTILFGQKVYAAPASNPVTLSGTQTFTKPDASLAADTFTYTLTAKETGNPMPSGSTGDVYTFTASGTGKMDMGSISFTQTGIYHYEAAQSVLSPKTGYTYDSEVYSVTVYINTDLKAEVIIQKEDGSKVDSMEFENQYTPLASDPSILTDPPVKKTVSGSPDKDGTFTFKLEAGNKLNPMPAGSTDGVKLVTLNGPGKTEFGTWSYTKAGTYYYTVSEVDNKEKGYTYDTAVYTITDHVKDVDGQLEVTRTVTNASNKQVGSCDFINKYTSTTGSGGKPGTPGGSGAGNGTNGPKTGDDSMIGFYQAMFGISGFLCLVCILYLLMAGKNRKEIKSMI